MKVARREIGKRRSYVIWLGLAAVAVVLFGLVGGYRLDFESRVVAKRVALYQEWEGMLDPAAKVVGYVEPGTECRLFQVGAKSILNFRVRCGNLIGWTAEGYSFDPPITAR
ncbi:hypothetical protein [Cupriavidus sp. L7L]|jgi:hypothetical protein|uniref:hypothetical protein n=1 Tax=Cupriavidus sp. L7L TaxID=2546443 RepID=UPI00105509D9|nr:hypothetical protein [Cupriavidus sp. L7L]TDF63308.1 hypothetical protein E1J61_25045 [Cupriavidus sp. L7L]